MMYTEITDVYEIRPDKRYANLGQRERVRLMDSVLNRDEKSRGLLVDFNLSNSGRVINRRVYMPLAQQLAAQNLSDKPIIKNHDSGDVDNVIGRFVGGRWNALDQHAVQFFRDTDGYMEVKRAFDTQDPKRIHRALHKHNLLTNDRWLGLGEIEAEARITDEQSIEKFLKGEYLHFSSGASTDRWACGICGCDWAKDGEPCEHRPGKVYDKFGPAVIYTGSYDVAEGSVVVIPGNNESKVRSMRMSDSAGQEIGMPEEATAYDNGIIYVTDAHFSGVEIMDEAQLQALLDQLKADLGAQLASILSDKLKELQTVTGTNAAEDNADSTVTAPAATETAQTSDTGASVENTNGSDANTHNAEDDDAAASTSQDHGAASQPNVRSGLLDLALKGATGVSRTAEELAAVDAKFVLGPDGKFVVDSAEALEAARDVLTNFNVEVSTVVGAQLDTLASQFTVSATDYANAMKQLQDLRAETADLRIQLQNALEKLDKSDATNDNDGGTSRVLDATNIGRVENDTGSAEDAHSEALEPFQRHTIDRYKQILSARGKTAADAFLLNKIAKRQLPRDFDITQHLSEEN